MQERFKTTQGPEGVEITFIDHPELHLPRRAEKLRNQAKTLTATPGTMRHKDNVVVFKGIHACGYGMYRSNRSRSRRRAQTVRELYELRQHLVDRLVNDNLGLVHDMQRRSGVTHVDSDDLFSEGLWTLYRAVTRFDPWQGFRFSTYACTSIRRGFLLVAKRQRRQAELRNKMREEEDGYAPTTIEEKERNIDMEVTMERLQRAVDDNEAGLSSMERFVLARRVLHPPGRHPQTLSSLGRMFDLSKEGIRQIQLHALAKLRRTIGDGEDGHDDDARWKPDKEDRTPDADPADDNDARHHPVIAA